MFKICSTKAQLGYLVSGLTAERVKAVVVALAGNKHRPAVPETLPFSRDCIRIFEVATHVGLRQ